LSNKKDYFDQLSKLNVNIIETERFDGYAPNFQSDFFRWWWLGEFGGFYLDTDQLILKPFSGLDLDSHFIYSSYGTRFLPNPKFIAGDYGIRNEITSRISEANSSTTGVNYKLIIPEEKNFLDKIYPDGRLFGASVKSVTDALGITKVGGKRKTRRSKR
jgi:hypothetical protein